jgi:hypothetical protein
MRPDRTTDDAVAWLTREAARYVTLAQGHADRALLMAVGTDKIAVNLRRRDQFQAMAIEAALIARQFIAFAQAIDRAQAPTTSTRPGVECGLPATFLRPCAAEDFPGQGLFRLADGQVVRAPLASPPAAPVAALQLDRCAG